MAPSPRPAPKKHRTDNADDVLVIRPTATPSTSSESLYTDPLTPLGFAATHNFDETDVSEGLTQPDRVVRRRLVLNNRRKLSLLSRSRIDVFDSTMMVDMESPLATNRMKSLELMMQKANAEAAVVGAAAADATALSSASSAASASSPMGSALFSVSRVKKIELPDLHVTKMLTDHQQAFGKRQKTIIFFR